MTRSEAIKLYRRLERDINRVLATFGKVGQVESDSRSSAVDFGDFGSLITELKDAQLTCRDAVEELEGA